MKQRIERRSIITVDDVLTRLLDTQLALKGLGHLLRRTNSPESGLCTEGDIGLGIVLKNLSDDIHELREELDKCSDNGKFVLAIED